MYRKINQERLKRKCKGGVGTKNRKLNQGRVKQKCSGGHEIQKVNNQN
jgi:hypothetical protein